MLNLQSDISLGWRNLSILMRLCMLSAGCLPPPLMNLLLYRAPLLHFIRNVLMVMMTVRTVNTTIKTLRKKLFYVMDIRTAARWRQRVKDHLAIAFAVQSCVEN